MFPYFRIMEKNSEKLDNVRRDTDKEVQKHGKQIEEMLVNIIV